MPRAKGTLTIEYALLGFVQAGPTHAYEIHQQLKQTEMLALVWRLKQRQLYALLERLEAEGYLAAMIEVQENRPPRRILYLTPSGAAAFHQWMTTPVDHGRDFRQEFMAKLYFAQATDAALATTLLQQQRKVYQAQVASFRARLALIPPDRHLDTLVFHFRIGQLEATLQWLDTCTALLPSDDRATPAAPGNLAPLSDRLTSATG
ncbi:MAG: PadR family transcriptional regulator [Caldilineaceae bacterium]|nr:PadR family transcriptional regulator [Caldilineaceae bacterium]